MPSNSFGKTLMALNPQNLLVDRYWQEGFIDGIEVLSAEEVKIHRAHLENAERALGHSLHYMSRVHTVLRSPFELATHPALVNLVEKIIGPDILLHNVTYIIKEPHTKNFASFHQDLTYWGFDGTEQVSAWLALSPATAESGCMRFIPGSHRSGLRDQVTGDDPDNVLFQSQTIEDVNEEEVVYSTLLPGRASLHHGWAIHASGPNISDDRRIGLNVQYISPRMKQTKDASDSAILIRGKDRYGHFIADQPATEWLPDEASARLRALTEKYASIAGTQ
jgi:ectoine hydroxylase-related dioxygenase (phytanoyl-CoA dioxygenase family)